MTATTLRNDIEYGKGIAVGVPHVVGVDYRTFIDRKIRQPRVFGFEVEDELNQGLFDWQERIVRWALRRGRAAIFADCGLGKTLMQLEWARCVHQKTGGKVLLHCPVGVREQTLRESSKFAIDCNVQICDSQEDVTGGISLVNYEKLHKFDPEEFCGVVLDESSILKNYTGATKRRLIHSWKHAEYRLACTATPAPNDHMELGNHAEFLGIMPSNEMLSRWFINDTMRAGGYRLKGHAETDFWQWMASWSVCVSKPSDIGGSDDGFELPELNEHVHVVDEDGDACAPGMLFNNFELSATNVHRQKRSTTPQRAERIAEIVANAESPFLVWCDTNYEADALLSSMPGSVDVRGSESDRSKQSKLSGFSDGDISVLITKPTVAGFGMNWQHCNQMGFVGLSYSFEAYYQAVRRCWRFGQNKPVDVHIVESDGEARLREATLAKQRQFQQMQRGMVDAVQSFQLASEITRDKYQPQSKMEVPAWLR